MALFTPDVGLVLKLNAVKGSIGWVVQLYQNDYTPVAGSILSHFTAANFGGYGPQDPQWGAVAMGAGGKAEMTSALLTWTKTSGGAQTIYGYFATNWPSPSSLMFAERFATPVPLNLNGDTIRLQIIDQMGRA